MDKYGNVYIFTDNKSAIQSVDTPMRQSGQYITEEILDIIDEIHERTPACIVHIEWVPGHRNIEGNEKADQAAKTGLISGLRGKKSVRFVILIEMTELISLL
jgi:ribonuclease HI